MQFVAQRAHLPEMMHYVASYISQITLPDSEQKKVEVAVEEALINIIIYAYPKNSKGTIDLECQLTPKQLDITIRDSGIPFNPLIVPLTIDRLSPLEERKLGGLGIYFILEFMDEIQYRRVGKENALHLRKNF